MKSTVVPAVPSVVQQPVPESRRPLRLAYVATDYFDPASVGAWSGLPYFIWHALEQQGIEITVIRLHDEEHSLRRWVRFGLCKLLGGRFVIIPAAIHPGHGLDPGGNHRDGSRHNARPAVVIAFPKPIS